MHEFSRRHGDFAIATASLLPVTRASSPPPSGRRGDERVGHAPVNLRHRLGIDRCLAALAFVISRVI
jgi:hypothetical protein